MSVYAQWEALQGCNLGHVIGLFQVGMVGLFLVDAFGLFQVDMADLDAHMCMSLLLL
jgi:hypothetical protein